MAKRSKQIENLTRSLSPRQLVFFWFEEAQKFDSIEDYVHDSSTRSRYATIRDKLHDQAAEAVRAEMKGQKEAEIYHAVRKARMDVDFLFMLISKSFQEVRSTRQEQLNMACWLLTELSDLEYRVNINRALFQLRFGLSFDIPYPLDPETAGAVEFAVQNAILTLDELDEIGCLSEWLGEHFVHHGKKALPHRAYNLQDENENKSDEIEIEHFRWHPDETVIAQLFESDGAFQAFKIGEDFSYGLADMPDNEFEEAYDKFYAAVATLLESREIKTGKRCRLGSVPIPFLREFPIIDGVWLEHYIIELAEWGALLEKRGFRPEGSQDGSLLAWDSFAKKSNNAKQHFEIDSEPIATLRHEAKMNLEKYTGRKRKIDGRDFLHLDDYHKWKGRYCKDKLVQEDGFFASSWNDWIDSNGGEGKANLSGYPVKKISSHATFSEFVVQNQAEDILNFRNKRRQIISSIQSLSNQTSSLNESMSKINKLVVQLAHDDLSLIAAIDHIRQRYFDGREILFKDCREDLQRRLKRIETSVDFYNHFLPIGSSHRIDLDAMKEEIKPLALAKARRIIDFAKADVFEAFDEIHKAVDTMTRYM